MPFMFSFNNAVGAANSKDDHVSEWLSMYSACFIVLGDLQLGLDAQFDIDVGRGGTRTPPQYFGWRGLAP
jgi:hypothetical protein